MATYQYRCPQDGLIETVLPLGTAPPALACPTCAGRAGRVFSAPRLSFGDGTSRALLDRTERSRDAPEVVSRLPPPRRTTRVASGPGVRRLPRP